MSIGLPPREVAIQKGWKFQVNYMDDGKPCMHRVTSRWAKDWTVQKLSDEGHCVEVIDLIQALGIDEKETA